MQNLPLLCRANVLLYMWKISLLKALQKKNKILKRAAIFENIYIFLFEPQNVELLLLNKQSFLLYITKVHS